VAMEWKVDRTGGKRRIVNEMLIEEGRKRVE